LGWFDDAIDWVEDNVVDPIVDAADDAVDWVEDNIVDPIADAADDVLEWIDENVIDPAAEVVGDIKEWIVDKIKDVGEFIQETWGDFTRLVEDFLATIAHGAGLALDFLTDAFKNAYDWVAEKVDDAIDWFVEAANKVYKFVVEEAIPYIVSLISFIPAVIKALGALLVLPLCYLYKKIFGDEEATVIQGIAEHDPRLMEEFRVSRLKMGQNSKYAVFSDVHMFVEGDLDFYNHNGNSTIYQWALNQYAGDGYHLIENGDIEDFWMRGGSSKGLILEISYPLPWPYYSELFESSAFRSANQVHAFNVFLNNAETYAIIRSNFQDRGKYTRLIGNHDDVWADSTMDPIFQLLYPNATVFDYCTLEWTATETTEFLLAHGHQSDTFNMPLCNFAGKALTELASHLHEITFGALNMFTKSKDWWESQWRGEGFKNELTETNLLKGESFSEYDLYKGVENIYGNSLGQPYLILGHTHHPKDNAGIPDFMFHDEWNWDEYSNSGTVGMWEEIVVGLEIEHPDVRIVAWVKEDSGIKRYELRSYRHGDTYLRA
jgi:hypothetical protein